MTADSEELLAHIRESIIGDDRSITTPFGQRRVIYADYTASGRSLTFIEDFMRQQVMPLYANTHTEASATGEQTTHFRENARQIIKASTGGGPDDIVIFCGSGATAAVNKLIDILNIRIPADLDQRYQLRTHIPEQERPMVFIGPYEHHSNELPWRETIADVVVIDEDADGHIDMQSLEHYLKTFSHRSVKIGSFSAASNVTGIQTDTDKIAQLLHRYGAHSFWDYAAAGPYVRIHMNSAVVDGAHKDAIFLSPHKFIGGPGTPGILIVKRHLLKNRVPSTPGGGTVAYVNAKEHRYLADPTHREEGGTPAILESIRAGLVFQLKDAVGAETIEKRERDFVTRAITRWEKEPNLIILGNKEAYRLSIVSFLVRHGDKYLHHNFVVALLNDLFGIQSRGGCSCAGPYGHRLLGIDLTRSREFAEEIAAGCEVIKPGWIRVNFNYFIDDAVFEFILSAVQFVARDGWRFLPDYDFVAQTGLWRHRNMPKHSLLSLDRCYPVHPENTGSQTPTLQAPSFDAVLSDAHQLAKTFHVGTPNTCAKLSNRSEALRWFHLPSDVE